MKLLSDILYKVGLEEVRGSTNLAIEQVCFDSRKVDRSSVFVAVKGTQVDGHDYIDKAVASGALAVVCETFPKQLNDQVTYVRVRNAAAAMGYMAANLYDNPASKLHLVGVTGTNGKTTTVTLLYRLFRSLGYEVGMLSTVSNRIGGTELPSTHTTPDAITINQLLAQMVEEGCSHCFMEVSSHSLVQHRVIGLDFNVAVFTNITHDHLDYHGTFDEYIRAKKLFFDFLGSDAVALLNKDDYHSDVMVQNTKAAVKTYALRTTADYKGKIIESQFSGLQMQVNGQELWSKLIGGFNAYNILAVFGVADLLEEETLSVLTDISSLNSVEGRFEYLKTNNNITGIVDYAHTPDALKNVLATIKDIRTGNEQVITVVGCGGDRDKAKRPKMAKIACKGSDRVILTSDNPRTEEPEAILQDMQAGIDPIDFKKSLSIADRKAAIKAAVTLAQPGDIVLVAGKGHEKYQEINGVRHDFDDLEVLTEMLKMVHN
ncbi:MAG: UDP-N-acetylmuramoyl-L-alanyl-D-glutamate--2,6-diaminopimelate ligase [Salibacteraceae bacterium]